MGIPGKPAYDMGDPRGRNDQAISRLLLACAVLAALFAGVAGWVLRDWSLGGFFLAVAVGAGALSAVFWPDDVPPPR